MADGALKAFRTNAGLSQVEVAARLGIGQATVSHRESASVLDLPIATMIEHIRATDPDAVMTVTASGVVLSGVAVHLSVDGPAATRRPKRDV